MIFFYLFYLSLNSVRNWRKTLLLRQPMKTCHVVICLFPQLLSPFLDFLSLSVPFELYPFSMASNPLLFPTLIHASTQWQWAFKFESKKRARKQAHQPKKVRVFRSVWNVYLKIENYYLKIFIEIYVDEKMCWNV